LNSSGAIMITVKYTCPFCVNEIEYMVYPQHVLNDLNVDIRCSCGKLSHVRGQITILKESQRSEP